MAIVSSVFSPTDLKILEISNCWIMFDILYWIPEILSCSCDKKELKSSSCQGFIVNVSFQDHYLSLPSSLSTTLFLFYLSYFVSLGSFLISRL